MREGEIVRLGFERNGRSKRLESRAVKKGEEGWDSEKRRSRGEKES